VGEQKLVGGSVSVAAFSWRNLALRLDPTCRFEAPVTRGQIAAAQVALKISLPDELCELFQETDGIEGQFGPSLVWPLARIVSDNIEFRRNPDFPALYMPFDPMLFFGDNGGGDQYAYRILAGGIEYMSVYEWEHETDSRNWFARDLRDYLARSSGHEQYDPIKHGPSAAD
jgi:hypothetical protein